MPSRNAHLAMCLAAVVAQPTLAAAPPQYFVVCASAPNLPTVYFSGIVQAQPSAFQEVHTGFAEYLAQHFSYKGGVACAPTNSLANAQKALESRSTALRNAKRNVVDTGWTGGGASIATQIGAALSPATAAVASQGIATSAKPAAAASGGAATGSARSSAAGRGAGSGGGSGSGGTGTSDLAGTLSSIFGSSGGCSAGSNGASGGGGKEKSAGGAPPQTAGGDAGCQSPYAQVSNTLTSLFGASTSGAQTAAGGEPRSSAAPTQQEGLGSAEAQSTKLVVYGCGRHDTQVACVSDLTNKNQNDTLVLSDVWKDAFIVDDRGDRHPRSKGFFLNVDGDQRSQLDIGYGKSARFVLMFDGVQSKVQKVALRSASGGLDVEDISLIASEGGAAAVQAR